MRVVSIDGMLFHAFITFCQAKMRLSMGKDSLRELEMHVIVVSGLLAEAPGSTSLVDSHADMAILHNSSRDIVTSIRCSSLVMLFSFYLFQFNLIAMQTNVVANSMITVNLRPL